MEKTKALTFSVNSYGADKAEDKALLSGAGAPDILLQKCSDVGWVVVVLSANEVPKELTMLYKLKQHLARGDMEYSEFVPSQKVDNFTGTLKDSGFSEKALVQND